MNQTKMVLREEPIMLTGDAPRRIPKRAPELQQAGFTEQFDFDTLFYCAYQVEDVIRFDGPPMLNLQREIASSSWFVDDKKISEDDLSVVDLERACGLTIAAVGEKLEWNLGEQNFSAEIGSSYVSVFEGLKCVYTKSKNNDLKWIVDWATFYSRYHDIEGVLIYDNGSTLYSPEELLAALTDVDGLKSIVIVDWPHKFGPHAGTSGKWDSDFFQHAVSANAQRRFLAKAKCVVSCDIDELILTDDNRPIYEHLLESEQGYLRYGDRLISGVPVNENFDSDKEFSFSDFGYYSEKPTKITFKWSCIPSSLPRRARWLTHAVAGIYSGNENHVLGRHFYAISTGWKYPRELSLAADKSDLKIDRQLRSALEQVGL